MKFIALNFRKIILVLFLYIVVSSLVAFILYLRMKRGLDADDYNQTDIMLVFVYSIAFVFFLFYTFSAIIVSYQTSKILPLGLQVFDECKFNFLYKDSVLTFTKQCVCGKINNYPVVMYFNRPIDKYSKSRIEFYFLITQFHATKLKLISFPPSEMKTNILGVKEDVVKFSIGLELDGFLAGDLESGKRQI
ncbi:MAG: hypothetical protein ABI169_13880 [Chitinophagaceae bacterium]